MTLVDTHSHLYDEAFDDDRNEAIERALAESVNLMLLPAIDSQSTHRLEALYLSDPDHFRMMAGLHPTSVDDHFEDELAIVEQQLKVPDRYIAIGEIGMDLYWDRTYEAQQREALKRQMQWAIEKQKPVALHIRKAHNEVFGLLREINQPHYHGVMHCFGGSVQEAYRAVEMGFCLGIGGVVTFKNATMAEVVKNIPLESLLLETDAPYLSPVPHRGQRNESSYIPLIASKVAEIKNVSVEEVAETTTRTAYQLFAL